MNTSHIPSRLPQAFSPINPTFASKADYLDFVQEWKAVYRYLSVSIRTARLRSRLRPNNRPAKQAALEKELCLLAVRLAAYGPCPYVDQGVAYGSTHVALGSAAATWLLALRAAAKLDAGRRRAAALAAGEVSPQEPAP
jgi:heme oxygenase